MRKGLTIFLIICIILIGLCQLVVPAVANGTVESKLKTALGTENVDVSISSTPGFMLLFGQLDTIHAEADNGMLGNIRCSKLVLDGKNVRADLNALDVQDGSAIQSADYLTLVGRITQDDLQTFLQQKLGKVDDLQVEIHPDKTIATGKIKLLGREADVSLQGIFYEEMGMIYFHMTDMKVRNAVLGNAVIGNFFGDILLLDLHSLAFPAQFDSVDQQEGYVMLKASRKVDVNY